MKKSVDNRNSIDDTLLNDPVFCDTQLSEGWYRFVTAVKTRTPEEEKLHIYARPCIILYLFLFIIITSLF